jgi:hypothetical protein
MKWKNLTRVVAFAFEENQIVLTGFLSIGYFVAKTRVYPLHLNVLRVLLLISAGL